MPPEERSPWRWKSLSDGRLCVSTTRTLKTSFKLWLCLPPSFIDLFTFPNRWFIVISPCQPLGLLLSTLSAPWFIIYHPSPLCYCYLPSQSLVLLLSTLPTSCVIVIYPLIPLVYLYLPSQLLGLLFCCVPFQHPGLFLSTFPRLG